MWFGDVDISQAKALNTGPYGVFPIFVSKSWQKRKVNNLNLFLITSIFYLQYNASMFKAFLSFYKLTKSKRVEACSPY